MQYFKPMLTDKELTMCQDITPNTAEGKKIMYAITWNEDGTVWLMRLRLRMREWMRRRNSFTVKTV